MFHRSSAPERLNCITDPSHGPATNGLFCQPCDRKILDAVRRDSEPLRTNANANTPPSH